MKNLKTFEEASLIKPKIGDYVILSTNNTNTIYIDFINNNIGRIVIVNKDTIHVYFDTKIPTSLLHMFDFNIRKVNNTLIKYISKNEEELEVIINANKFNL